MRNASISRKDRAVLPITQSLDPSIAEGLNDPIPCSSENKITSSSDFHRLFDIAKPNPIIEHDAQRQYPVSPDIPFEYKGLTLGDRWYTPC